MSNYPEPTVGAVISNPEGKILLCKSHKWDNKYVIPGGHIEQGEKMEDALKREILEETGLTIHDIKLIGMKECIYSSMFHERKHFIFIDYQCKTSSSHVVLNHEAEEYIWADMDKIDDYNLGGFTRDLLYLLREGKDSGYYTGIFYNY